MTTDDLRIEDSNIGTAQTLSLHKALQTIKEHQCYRCGIPAKGFVYRNRLPIYYCKNCLDEELDVERQL